MTLDVGIKKGVPLYSNLVNLKSNTMKNTMQIYIFTANRPNKTLYFYGIFHYMKNSFNRFCKSA